MEVKPTKARASCYAAGTRVVAKTACHNGLTEDGIGGYCCRPGDILVIRAVGNRESASYNWDYWVSHENVTDSRFGVNAHEIEPLREEVKEVSGVEKNKD